MDTGLNSPIKQETVLIKNQLECIENVSITIETVEEGKCLKKEPLTDVNVKIEPVSMEEETKTAFDVQVKTEIVCVKEEPNWMGTEWEESEESPQAALYADHDVKPDLVIGTESLQPTEAAFTIVPRRQKISKSDEKRNSSGLKVPTLVKYGRILGEHGSPVHEVKQAYASTKNRQLPTNIDYTPDIFICDTCFLSFTTKTRLIKHLSFHKYKNKDSYYCNICDKSFLYYTYKATHQKLHAGYKEYTCDICQKSFACAGYLRRHQRIHTGEKPHVCEVCKKAFREKSQLYIHAMIHEGDKAKRYQCGTCPMKFAQRYKLVLHERIHTRTQPCLEKFSQNFQRGIHSRIRTKEKQPCLEKFSQNLQRGIHSSVRTKEKSFSCDTCNKSFLYKNDLERHQRIHTGLKPYPCDVCGKSFSQSAHLKSHMVTHTGEKPYKCEVCSKEFSAKFSLTKHRLTHVGEPDSLVCKVCKKEFTMWGRLKRHELKCQSIFQISKSEK